MLSWIVAAGCAAGIAATAATPSTLGAAVSAASAPPSLATHEISQPVQVSLHTYTARTLHCACPRERTSPNVARCESHCRSQR